MPDVEETTFLHKQQGFKPDEPMTFQVALNAFSSCINVQNLNLISFGTPETGIVIPVRSRFQPDSGKNDLMTLTMRALKPPETSLRRRVGMVQKTNHACSRFLKYS